MRILKAIKEQPARKPLSLVEYAAGLQAIRGSDPGMTLEELAEFVRRDVRFVRRVLAIAERVKTNQ